MQDESALVVAPPRRPLAAPVDWATLEANIGTALPDDYKWIIERYGPGSFDEFLHVLEPPDRPGECRRPGAGNQLRLAADSVSRSTIAPWLALR